MSPITILITIAGYFAVLFSVSYFTGRKADNAGFFSGYGRIIAYGAPFLLCVITFAALGIFLLVVTRDRQLKALIQSVRRKGGS